jgi:glutaryl-CoA dehydrogenase (non-decarboxylating)
MFSLELSEEHRAVERTAREWAAREVAPRIHDLDRERRFERSLLKGMAELQLLGLCIPEEHGGAGMDYISLGLASEELEYVDTHLRVILSVHVALNSMTLWCWGNEEQRTRLLAPQARGERIATYGLTEPSAGSDAVGIESTAVRRGDRYVLNGEKTWISLADVADHFLVIAWTDLDKKKRRDHSGLSAFLVERRWKGFSSYSLREKWGILAGNTGGFHMDDVEVPVENRIGHEGEGFRIAMFALENGRYTVAAGATGLIRACLDASVKYAKERSAFGSPIGRHQLVKEMIAEMVSDYDASRLLWLRAGWMKNEGRRNTRETALAKWFATVRSERAASDCVQIHGGNGFSDEYPAGRFFRNAKAAVIYEGTREIHKLMQADYALGYREDKPRRVDLPAYPR